MIKDNGFPFPAYQIHRQTHRTGVSLIYPLSPYISIVSDPEYIEKDYLKRSVLTSDIQEKFQNSYLQIPFTVRFSLLNRGSVNTFFDIGPYIAYWLVSKDKGQLPDLYSAEEISQNGDGYQEYYHLDSFNQKIDLNANLYNRFESGMMLGGGERLKLSNSSLLIRLFVSSAFTSQFKKYTATSERQFNQSINLINSF